MKSVMYTPTTSSMTRSSAIKIQNFSSNQHLTNYNINMRYALSLSTITYSAFLFFSVLNTAGVTGCLGGYTLSM